MSTATKDAALEALRRDVAAFEKYRTRADLEQQRRAEEWARKQGASYREILDITNPESAAKENA